MRTVLFNKTAFEHIMFIKIILIVVSILYFWGRVPNKRESPGHYSLWRNPVVRCPCLLVVTGLQPPGLTSLPLQAVLSLWAWEAGLRPALQAGREAHPFCICANQSASSNIHLNFLFKPLSCIIASIVLVTDKCPAINQS